MKSLGTDHQHDIREMRHEGVQWNHPTTDMDCREYCTIPWLQKMVANISA
jgi:hypothetical protein